MARISDRSVRRRSLKQDPQLRSREKNLDLNHCLDLIQRIILLQHLIPSLTCCSHKFTGQFRSSLHQNGWKYGSTVSKLASKEAGLGGEATRRPPWKEREEEGHDIALLSEGYPGDGARHTRNCCGRTLYKTAPTIEYTHDGVSVSAPMPNARCRQFSAG